MNILLGLLLGAGAFLLWWSCWPVPAGEERPNREPKMVIMLRKAGMHSLSLRTFMWLSVGSAAITALVDFCGHLPAEFGVIKFGGWFLSSSHCCVSSRAGA